MKLEKIIAVRNNKTIYRDGDKSIKVFNEGFSKADVLNEALNQARIEGTGLNIPKVLEVTMIDGKWAIVFSDVVDKREKSLGMVGLVARADCIHERMKELEKRGC